MLKSKDFQFSIFKAEAYNFSQNELVCSAYNYLQILHCAVYDLFNVQRWSLYENFMDILRIVLLPASHPPPSKKYMNK